MDGLDLDLGGIGHEGADDQAGAVAQRVHAEQCMRRTMLRSDQTANFFLGQYHVECNLAEFTRNETEKRIRGQAEARLGPTGTRSVGSTSSR